GEALVVGGRVAGRGGGDGDDAAPRPVTHAPDVQVRDVDVVHALEGQADSLVEAGGIEIEELGARRATEVDAPLADHETADDPGDGVEPGPAQIAPGEQGRDGEGAGEAVGDDVRQRGAVVVIVMAMGVSVRVPMPRV